MKRDVDSLASLTIDLLVVAWEEVQNCRGRDPHRGALALAVDAATCTASIAIVGKVVVKRQVPDCRKD